ncbi:MAG: hypothetical protein HZC49_02805 [Nitrospirae bacterium]|nr:hypothetical protein [Nitrospirota bacterium]
MTGRETTSGSVRVSLRLKASLFLYVCIIALFVFLPVVALAGWTVQGADMPKIFSYMSSKFITIDGTTGHPHIAYGGDHLYHAYYNGTQWTIETVDDSPGVGKAASIAVDSNGKVHISYLDSIRGDLKYATNVFGVWEAIQVDTDVDESTSIAIDSHGNAHISYYDSINADLKYATNASGSWVITAIDSAGIVGKYTSIAIDSLNKAHIGYFDWQNSSLKYATNASGSWVKTTVESSVVVGNYLSIAVDGSRKAHISYYDETNTYLKYATNTTGSWVKTTVDSAAFVGATSSIAVDSSNKAHISYYDSTNANLKYATNTSGSWVKTTVDSTGDAGNISAISVDSSNKAHISYYDSTTAALEYATNTSGSWVISIIDNAGLAGDYNSIAVDGNGKAHISYYDTTKGDLKYATNASGMWVTATIDSSGDVGEYTSIAVDGSGKVYISYLYNYSQTDADLRYATNSGVTPGTGNCSGTANWNCTSIDTATYNLICTSIAVDADNKAHISYYDSTNDDLKYATNVSGSWVKTTVAGRGGYYNSIAVDSSRKAHISYYESYLGSDTLKYATNASGSWVTVTVDNNGRYNSIAVDSSNKEHISYQGNGSGLSYATNSSGSWVSYPLDSISSSNTSIALDSSNKVHISYSVWTDEYTYELKYVTNTPGSWATATVDNAGDVGNRYTSIAVDSGKKVHISYNDWTNFDLKYATNAPIDITPPVGTIIINSNAVYTNTAAVTLTLTCGDLQSACSQMQFSNDGASWSAPETYASSRASWDIAAGVYGGTSPDGLKYVYARFEDSSGNWSDSYSDTITLDTTPPTGAPAVTGTTPTNNTRPAWSWTSTGGGGNGTFRYKLDDSNLTTGATETTATSYAPVIDLSEATHTLYVQERDMAGNWSVSGSFAITIDSTLPNSPIVTGTTPTNSRRPSWNWSSTGGNINFRYKLDDSNLITGATATTATSYTPVSDLSGGAHTLYVQEKDTAGNWSNSGSHTILIDITAPSGTITINSGAASTNDPSVTMGLTCNDGTGSGCSQMQFSDNNGTSWTTPEAFSETKFWTLSGDGDKTIYVKFKDAVGNWSNAFSDTIILDETAPATTAIPPGGLKQTAQTVTLFCDDNTGSGCANTYYCTGTIGSVCDPTTLYNYSPSTQIQISSNTDLRFYSVDMLGNEEPVNTDTYTFVQTATDLSMELSAPRILSGHTVDAVGQLLRLPENGASRNGLTIRFEITGPSPVPPATQTVTYTNSGLYSHTISGFITEGIYNIKAVFDGNGLLLPDESPVMNVYVGPSAGYAIIVEGKIPGGGGLASHNKTTNRIYAKLKARGFNDSDIYYFNYDTGQAGVDEAPARASVQAAVQYWAKFKMNDIAAPLYIIMTDHGDETDGIYLDSESITPADLNTWLNSLEGGLNAVALQKKRVVIVGACYSGAFIPAVSKSGRVVISSSADNEVSHKGPYESDSGVEIRSGEFFMEELFTFLERGYTIKDAFEEATEKTEIFTRRDSVSGEVAPYYDEAVQHPLLDDDGDGYGSNMLSGTEDGNEVDELYVGVGNYYVPNRAANPAELTEVTETAYLSSAEATYTMWAEVNDNAKIDGGRIWYEVRKPSKSLPGGSGNEQVAADYVYNFLLYDSGLHWEKQYNDFDEYGRYEIFYFVRDAGTQKVSPMKRSIVYRDDPGNLNYPDAFNLTLPADGSEQMSKVILDWEGSVDADGDEVTYTVMISRVSDFATVDYIREEIKDTWAMVGDDGELLVDTLYYWKVVAADSYGKRTESNQVWSFNTNCLGDPENCNGTAFPGIITGYVYVNGTNPAVPIANATITTSNGRSATSGANGTGL